MKIAFLGTSDRSIPILQGLKNSKFELVLCITKEDSIVGRKKELKPTAVKTWCLENRVNFLTIERFDVDTRQRVANAVLKENIELGVVADFSFMIPEEIFTIFKHGLINIHFSMLPHYRGASPIQTAIINGDKKTGISYAFTSKGMDTGKIIHQTEYDIYENDTNESLNERLFLEAGKNLPNVLQDYLDNKLIPYEQDSSKATYTYSKTNPKTTLILKEDAQIDWKKPLELIERKIRAYKPWPIAWTTLGDLNNALAALRIDKTLRAGKNPNLKVKILEAKIVKNHDKVNLKIEKLQVEGKNPMLWNEFENGYLENLANTIS